MGHSLNLIQQFHLLMGHFSFVCDYDSWPHTIQITDPITHCTVYRQETMGTTGYLSSIYCSTLKIPTFYCQCFGNPNKVIVLIKRHFATLRIQAIFTDIRMLEVQLFYLFIFLSIYLKIRSTKCSISQTCIIYKLNEYKIRHPVLTM